MNKKVLFAILTFLVPIIGSSQNFGNVLKGTIKREIVRAIEEDYAINMSEFSIAQSQGKYYWFVKLTNNSTRVIPQGRLKIQASQYDKQGNTQAAGIPIESNLTIDPDRSIQLQREFIPMPGLTSIRVDAYQKNNNKKLLSQPFAVTTQPSMPAIKAEEKKFEMQAVYSVETTLMIDLGDFNLLVWNRGNGAINAKDFTVQTRWEHVFKPDTVEEEKTLPDAMIQPGKYYAVKLTSGYVYKCITDKKIIVTAVNHKENKTYITEKGIVPPKFTLTDPVWYHRNKKLTNKDPLPSSGTVGYNVTVSNQSPYRISGILTIKLTPLNMDGDMDGRSGNKITAFGSVKSPGKNYIEPFKSAQCGGFFAYALPRKGLNDRAFRMVGEISMEIPYETLTHCVGVPDMLIGW